MHAPRSVLDTILQSCAVEMFHSADLTVAPLERSLRAPMDLTGCTGASLRFAGPGFRGELTLWIPEGVFDLLRGREASSRADWTCEMANQLLGRIRNRLAAFQIELTSSLPVALNPSVPAAEPWDSEPLGVYGFRTLRGVVTVILTGATERTSLVCAGPDEPEAGEIILF